MAEERRGPEIHVPFRRFNVWITERTHKFRIIGTILLISQRDPKPIGIANFAKRLKEFLKGWTIFYIRGLQTVPVL